VQTKFLDTVPAACGVQCLVTHQHHKSYKHTASSRLCRRL